MINRIVKAFFNKELVLYFPHRQTIPILKNEINRKNFVFVPFDKVISLIPFRSNTKKKYIVLYFLLKIISPRYILNINWIARHSSLYKLYCRNNPETKSVVLQHGSYVGGVVTDIAHRYTNCDIFLTWSDYFANLFQQYNFGKKVEILTFGNTIYNEFDRNEFKYKTDRTFNILLAPSVISGKKLQSLINLYNHLISLGFNVKIKEHKLQSSRSETIQTIPQIKSNIYDILRSHNFDIIIVDHSSVMLDAIFFKNPVIYFSPKYGSVEFYSNVYSEYLKNIYDSYLNIKNVDDFYHIVNIGGQETLLSKMIFFGTNAIMPST